MDFSISFSGFNHFAHGRNHFVLPYILKVKKMFRYTYLFSRILIVMTMLNQMAELLRIYFVKFAVLPSFTSKPSDLTVREDSEAIFLCTATGNPTPTITWMKDGKTVGLGDELRFSAKRNQSGEYRCSADNGLSVNITASASLDVQCKLT